jgi:hypothetical protein
MFRTRSWGARRQLALLAAVAAAMATTVIGVAQAAAPATKVVFRHGGGSFTAPCPGDSVVLGGGAGVKYPDGGGFPSSHPALTRSAPVTNSQNEPRWWRANLRSTSAGYPFPGSVYAICGKKAEYRQVIARQGEGSGEVTKSCHDDEVALGGGAEVDRPAAGYQYLARSEPLYNANRLPTGWKANIMSLSGSGPYPVKGTVYAICQKRSAAPNLRVRSHHAGGEFVVRCQRDEMVTGGGAGVDQLDGPDAGLLARSQPSFFKSGRPFAWKGNLRRATGPESSTVSGSVYVICAS